MNLVEIADALVADLRPLRFGSPVSHVYNPLEYAGVPARDYLLRYGQRPCEVILLGMNPGPWGMAQTGVPFGDVGMVRDWLGIHGRVGKPEREHPKRPIDGFGCGRSEVSGSRLWGWARDTFKTPARFFNRFFLANYCPLAFLEASGKNFTPDRLPKAQRMRLQEPCDRALRATVKYLRPRQVVGVGRFAETRATTALVGLDVQVGRILHPSPASPAANRGWAEQAAAELRSLGIRLPSV